MTSRVTYTFQAGQAGPETLGSGGDVRARSLAEHLSGCIGDTGASAVELACEVAQRAQEWVFAQELEWTQECAEAGVEEALRALGERHAWRGVMATWIDQVRGTLLLARERAEALARERAEALARERAEALARERAEALARERTEALARERTEALARERDAASTCERPAAGPRSLLAEEIGLWAEEDGSLRAPGALLTPLCDAARTIPARALAPHVLRQLSEGETILMIGWSPELVECARAAYSAGLAPEALVAEGRPSMAGRRLIRDLAQAGVRTRMVLDACIWDAARAADRVWVASESIGSQRTITSLGVTGILELCASEEIPIELLSTTDACHPSGVGVAVPAGDPDRIWGDRPEGVAIEAAIHESVPTRAFTRWYSEHGAQTPATHRWPDPLVRPEAACGAAVATGAMTAAAGQRETQITLATRSAPGEVHEFQAPPRGAADAGADVPTTEAEAGSA